MGSLASVSGTAGIVEEEARSMRAAKDDSLAAALARGGMVPFLRAWYAQPLWTGLRAHPRSGLLTLPRAAEPCSAHGARCKLHASEPLGGRVAAACGRRTAVRAAGAV